MKKILIAFLILLTLCVLALPCFAQEVMGPENTAAEGSTETDAQTPAQDVQIVPVENYAGEKSIAELVQDYALEHWDSAAVIGFIIYYILPKIGGRAQIKKMANTVTTTLDTYFGDENNDKNVLSVQRRLSDAQERFMNDAGDILERIKEYVAPLVEFVEEFKQNEHARATMEKLSVAVEGAVELMASQLNDLVLASPSISAKKKEEIESVWMAKIKEIHAALGMAVSTDDGQN